MHSHSNARYSRHLEVTPLDTRLASTVPARYYNRVQTGLKKLGPEIRLRVPELKHLDLILQKDAWIVVDRALNDMPVVAWMHFDAVQRGSLHEPIACEVRIWHALASMITARTLRAMEVLLRAELADLVEDSQGFRTLRFPETGE